MTSPNQVFAGWRIVSSDIQINAPVPKSASKPNRRKK
jgi:hypothetical protein